MTAAPPVPSARAAGVAGEAPNPSPVLSLCRGGPCGQPPQDRQVLRKQGTVDKCQGAGRAQQDLGKGRPPAESGPTITAVVSASTLKPGWASVQGGLVSG